MQLRDHPGVISKRDYYVVDPRTLKVEPGYNVRTLDSPDAREHIASLKESIAPNGVRVPLEVRLAGEDVFVVSGHCRLAAVMELIAEGHEIKGVPCIPESKSTNDAERTLNLAISNSGKPLTTLEVAEVVRRLQAFGWSDDEIQRRMRWKSKASVSHHAEVASLPQAVKQQISTGDVSASLAVQLRKEQPEMYERMLRENIEENLRIRGKRKVTKKTIERHPDRKPMPKAAATIPDPQPNASPPVAPADPDVCVAQIRNLALSAIADARELISESGEITKALHALAHESRQIIRAIELENPAFAFGGFLDAVREAESLLAQMQKAEAA